MQEALNCTCKWATDWCVTINSQKTVATCFSPSNTKETFKLTVNHHELPPRRNPHLPGRQTGQEIDLESTHQGGGEEGQKETLPHIMKKLAGTKWGASSNILKQVYTGNVRPVMEYGAAAWATAAAKSNTSRLAKVQNAGGMRIIT